MSKTRIALATATVTIALIVGVVANLTAQECNCINGYNGQPGLWYVDGTGYHCRSGGCYIITEAGIKGGAKGERMRPQVTRKSAAKTASHRVRTSKTT
jgi:hypothetical protein